MWLLPTGPLAVVASAALLAAACSVSGANTPHVTSSAKSTANRSTGTNTPSTGGATQLLNKWAVCMRSHGDPGQDDPTTDTAEVIHITVPAGDYDGVLPSGQNPDAGKACIQYLAAAQNALRGGQPFPASPSQAGLVKFAQCMQANGVSVYLGAPRGEPNQVPPGSGQSLHQSSPAYQHAAGVCVKETGVSPPGDGVLPAGAIEVGGGPAGNGVGLVVFGPVNG
jgi:hypothetical protein